MSAFTIDYELAEDERGDLWGTTSWGQGNKRRLYRIVGIRLTRRNGRVAWQWLGYPCRADGEALKAARIVVAHGTGGPDQATRVKVLSELRADLNRFDLETAKP